MFMRKIMLTVIGLLTTMGLFAYETWTDPETGVEWKYVIEDGYSILYGDAAHDVSAISRHVKGVVAIPADIDGYPIAEVMPEAFCGCQGVAEFQVHPDNAFFVAIDGVVYDVDMRTLIRCPQKKTEVVIPAGVRKIAEGAFAGCTELSSVVLPDSLEQIERNAFWGCTLLKMITIPASVVVMDSGCLSGCINLKDVYFDGDAPDIRVAQVYTIPLIDEYGEELYYIERQTETVDCNGNVSSRRVVLSNCVPRGYYSQSTVTTDDGSSTRISETASEYQATEPYRWYRYDSYLNYDISQCPDDTGIMTNCHLWAIYDSMDGWACSRTSPILTTHAKRGCHGWNWGDPLVEPSYWCGRKLLFYDGDSPSGGGQGNGDNLITLVTTNIVIHYIVNSIQPEKVIPPTMDTGFVNIITEVKSGGAVSVPETWSLNYSSFTEKYGSDFTKALMKPTGKRDGAGNEMLVWQDYVAGTDPTDENDVFTASVTIVEGKPVVSYTPELTAEETAKRIYKTWGKVRLQDADWTETSDATIGSFNFFKVSVEMR